MAVVLGHRLIQAAWEAVGATVLPQREVVRTPACSQGRDIPGVQEGKLCSTFAPPCCSRPLALPADADQRNDGPLREEEIAALRGELEDDGFLVEAG